MKLPTPFKWNLRPWVRFPSQTRIRKEHARWSHFISLKELTSEKTPCVSRSHSGFNTQLRDIHCKCSKVYYYPLNMPYYPCFPSVDNCVLFTFFLFTFFLLWRMLVPCVHMFLGSRNLPWGLTTSVQDTHLEGGLLVPRMKNV